MKNYLNNNFDFEQIIDFYDELPLWSSAFGAKLLNSVKYTKGITALDIGFGTGFPLLELAMRLGDSCTLYGIDPWPQGISRTKNKMKAYGITNVKIIEGYAEKVPLPDSSLDLITSNNGVNNASDIATVFDECARLLKRGGQFIQTMNTAFTMFEFYNTLEDVLRQKGLFNEIEITKKHIEKKRPDTQTICEMLRARGFYINAVEVSQFNYRFTDATAMFNHYFIRLAFIDSWKSIMPETICTEIFEEVENILNNYSYKKGELSLSVPFVLIDSEKI